MELVESTVHAISVCGRLLHFFTDVKENQSFKHGMNFWFWYQIIIFFGRLSGPVDIRLLEEVSKVFGGELFPGCAERYIFNG